MGIKKSKNARRMQMVFFVHTGKVHVEVANREFSICKGGIWQVPRGKLRTKSALLSTIQFLGLCQWFVVPVESTLLANHGKSVNVLTQACYQHAHMRRCSESYCFAEYRFGLFVVFGHLA